MAKPIVRLRAVQLAFGVGIAMVLGRAAQVQLLNGREYADKARAQRTEELELPARRGTIYDRSGAALAQTVEVYSVGVAPNELVNAERDAALISDRLGLPRRTVRRQLNERYAYFHGPFTSVQVQELRSVRGVHLTSSLERFHPNPELARALLGHPAADGRAASGMERVLDTLLTGVAGNGIVLRDRQGRTYESPARLGSVPTPGHDAYLTIDAALQEIVEEALDEAISDFGADAGDAVVVDPATGEILAIASRTEDGRSTANAFNSIFEPGSTAKVFAAAALLVDDLASATDSVWAERGTYVTENRTINDVHPNGWLSLRQVIEQSSNIGIVKFARRLSPESQYSMLRAFGLGTPTGVEFPSESRGQLRRPASWSGITGESMAMGYELSVTPLQLAQAYAAIANGGVLLRPTLIKRVVAPDGRAVHEHAPEPVRRAVPPDVAGELLTALRGVVYPGGTGETAALRGYEVAGKTGTTRRAGPGGYVPGEYTATFASIFPADRPQLVAVVKLDNPAGRYGGVTAAPVTRAVLEQILAGETGALDRKQLAGEPAPNDGGPHGVEPWVSQVFAWPPPELTEDEPESVRVPRVTGLTLREAARRIHSAGLRMRLTGWGKVVRTDPPDGVSVAPATVVHVTAGSSGGDRR